MGHPDFTDRGFCSLLSTTTSPSYSPASLGHLPQPVPNDIPRDLDATIFTFQDAFEDLLTVSNGGPLPDIRTRHQQRQLLRNMFPSGEPNWFWLRRLEAHGLLRAPRPGPIFRVLEPNWARLHEDLEREAAQTWHGGDREKSSDVFEDIDRTFAQLNRGLFGSSQSEAIETTTQSPAGHNGEPDSFDQLYSKVSSRFVEGTSTWDLFVKLLGGASAESNKKVVRSQDEHVDDRGYLHKVVTYKTLDDEGHEIGRETTVVVRPIEKHLDNEPQEAGNDNKPMESEGREKGSSWFWK